MATIPASSFTEATRYGLPCTSGEGINAVTPCDTIMTTDVTNIAEPADTTAPYVISQIPSRSETPAAQEFSYYFNELCDIELAKSTTSLTDEETPKTPDEGEQEMGWLQDAGYGHLVSKFEQGVVLTDDIVSKETSSLTKPQAAAVKKRIDTLNETLRKRRKQRHKPHVKDVFMADEQIVTNQASMESLNSITDPSSSERLTILTNHNGASSKSSHRVSLLRNRGGYSMNGSTALEAIDTLSSPGVEILRVRHSTDRDMRRTTDVQPSSAMCVGRNGWSGSMKTSQQLHLRQQMELVPGQSLDVNGLPELMLSDDSLGTTYISDLSRKDLTRIQPLALIELTSLYDAHGVTYVRGKQTSRTRESGLFGVPLQTLLDQDEKRYPELQVPLIFSELIQYLTSTSLDEEGILRVPGSVTRVKSLQHELTSLYKRGRLALPDDIQSHDAAALFKLFLRELPAPLLTSQYLEAFTQVDKINELRQKIESLNLLILLLPEVNRNTLQLLLQFLQLIVENPNNKMTIKNVAMVMAPNLFYVRSSRSRNQPSVELEISTAARTSNIVQLMIKYQRLLWAVPQFLLYLVRHQYQTDKKRTKKSKSIIRMLGKTDKSSSPANSNKSSASLGLVGTSSSHNNRGMIRINAPQLSKFNTTIQLDAQLTAGDVLARFSQPATSATIPKHSTSNLPFNQRRDDSHNSGRRSGSGSVSSSSTLPLTDAQNIHLYEIGGNIGERRVDNGTNMLSLYNINPNAEWVIRTQNS